MLAPKSILITELHGRPVSVIVNAAYDSVHTTVKPVDQHRHRTPRGDYRDGDPDTSEKARKDRLGRVCKQE